MISIKLYTFLMYKKHSKKVILFNVKSYSESPQWSHQLVNVTICANKSSKFLKKYCAIRRIIQQLPWIISILLLMLCSISCNNEGILIAIYFSRRNILYLSKNLTKEYIFCSIVQNTLLHESHNRKFTSFPYNNNAYHSYCLF